jgi:ADP-ribose pyrophosphatase YjhB (NUDIX family)
MAAISELARVRLAQGDLAGALAHVEEVLDHLDTSGPEGIPELLMVYLNCYRVLQAAGDLWAGSILDTAYEHLQENAAKIDDERLRRSYLENVTTHREIVEAYERREGTE